MEITMFGDSTDHEHEKYDGVCEKCSSRTRSDLDHVDDLILRICRNQDSSALVFLHSHWPHFSRSSRLMQFHCKLCRLHFKGGHDFLHHIFKCQTEENFMTEKNMSPAWSKNIGEKHTMLFKNLVNFIKKIFSEGPTLDCIPLLEEFLCPNTPRYFETAYRNTNFGDKIDSEANLDTINNNFILHDYELELARGADISQHEMEDDNPLPSYSSSLDLLRPTSLDRKLADIVSCKRRRLTHEEPSDQHGNGEEAGTQDVKSYPAKPFLHCLLCSESIFSVRHHINDVLWMKPESSSLLRHQHLQALFLTQDSAVRTNNLQVFYCPACNFHLHPGRGFFHVVMHLKHVAMATKNKFNTYAQKHLELVNLITELIVQHTIGDISREVVVEECYKKFICSEGGLSDYRAIPDGQTKCANSHPTNKRPAVKSLLEHTIGDISREVVVEECYKKFICSEGGHTDYREIPDGQTKCANSHQTNKRPAVKSLLDGDEVKLTRHNIPQLMEFSTFKPVNKLEPRLDFIASTTQYAMGKEKLTCDLCETPVTDMTSLKDHLHDALFTGNQQRCELHVTCLPRNLVYKTPCQCPACGIHINNFIACLQHICLLASDVEKDSHMSLADTIIDHYIRCMGSQITLNDVAKYIKITYRMPILSLS